jgi:hypothetical protein
LPVRQRWCDNSPAGFSRCWASLQAAGRQQILALSKKIEPVENLEEKGDRMQLPPEVQAVIAKCCDEHSDAKEASEAALKAVRDMRDMDCLKSFVEKIISDAVVHEVYAHRAKINNEKREQNKSNEGAPRATKPSMGGVLEVIRSLHEKGHSAKGKVKAERKKKKRK